MASPITIGSASPIPSLYTKTPRKSDNPEPDDTFNSVYMNIFYQGISAHFPWNVLLTGHGFFKKRLDGLEMARDFLSHFTFIFIIIKLIFLLAALFILRKYNPKWQVFSATLGNSVTFLALTIVCCASAMSQVSFYVCTLILVLFGSIFSAVWEAGMLTILGQFPVKYTQAYMAGSGVAGVIVIIVNIAAYFIAGTFETQEFAEFYFGISCALIAAGLVLFWVLQQNPFYKHYNKLVEEVASQRAEEVKESISKIKDCSSFMEIFTEVREIAIAAMISSIIGFIIFPELFFNTKSTMCGTSQENWFHRDMFLNTALFLANAFELFGKLLPLIPTFSFQNGPFILVSLSRALMIPFYALGNYKIKGYILPFKHIFASDILFFTLVSISSLTSSYLHTVSLMWAPTRAKPHERSVAVAIIIIFGAIGFIIGTSISMIAKSIIIAHSTPTV